MKIQATSPEAARAGRAGAFTLVELLVIIALVAVLAVMLVPAMASTKDRVTRAACANNLKELGMGALTYAEHYDGRYPITQAGANPVNTINGGFYTRWVFFDSNRQGFHLSQTWDAGTAPDDPDASGIKTGTFWRNFGMLYPEKLAGDGKIFYCPALNAKGSLIGSAPYQPLLTTSTPANDGATAGSVRSSYLYNPWVVSPGVNNTRLYVKTSDVKGRKVFGMDFMDNNSWNSDGTPKTGATDFAHVREGGWNILFADNSVHFYKADFRTRQVYVALGGFSSASDIQGICNMAGNVFEKFE